MNQIVIGSLPTLARRLTAMLHHFQFSQHPADAARPSRSRFADIPVSGPAFPTPLLVYLRVAASWRLISDTYIAQLSGRQSRGTRHRASTSIARHRRLATRFRRGRRATANTGGCRAVHRPGPAHHRLAMLRARHPLVSWAPSCRVSLAPHLPAGGGVNIPTDGAMRSSHGHPVWCLRPPQRSRRPG